MIYNVVLFSKPMNTVMYKLKSLDGRPLRFTDYKYAEREVHERNERFGNLMYDEGLVFMALEETDANN